MMQGPKIPAPLLHGMEEIRLSGGHDYAHGGQWSGKKEERVSFFGVVLPVGNKDLQYAPPGTYTKDSRKLYTNGHSLAVGAQVFDPLDQSTYTVKQELEYGPINGLKQFAVECKKGSAPK